ncbi:hypothetical protein F5887DRAFT_916835 [Amanita rubescens]|nr:hypothetical protein F5887DRAFT_916835 [Amanita rubescens]
MPATRMVAFSEVAAEIDTLHARFKKESLPEESVAYRLHVKTWIKPPPFTQDTSGALLEWRYIERRKCLTYQSLIDRIRVVAHSDAEIEMPENGNPGFSSCRNQSAIAKRDETDEALDALFATKKRKVESGNSATPSTPSASTSRIVATKSKSRRNHALEKGRKKQPPGLPIKIGMT